MDDFIALQERVYEEFEVPDHMRGFDLRDCREFPWILSGRKLAWSNDPDNGITREQIEEGRGLFQISLLDKPHLVGGFTLVLARDASGDKGIAVLKDRNRCTDPALVDVFEYSR